MSLITEIKNSKFSWCENFLQQSFRRRNFREAKLPRAEICDGEITGKGKIFTR